MTLRLKIERTALFLFVGGISYGLLELLWRGRTHWTMLLLGGVCFLCIGTIRRKGFSLPLRSLLCALIVTALEFLTGCVVNLRLHWAVWDYSANRFQLLGQVCALYSFCGCCCPSPPARWQRLWIASVKDVFRRSVCGRAFRCSPRCAPETTERPPAVRAPA